MIPLRDVIPTRTTPFVAIALIGVNAIASGYVVVVGRSNVVLILWLAVNMLYLWLFGENVEDRMGHGRFLVFYLFCAAAATLVHMAAEMRTNWTTAIGGATAGVMGGYLVLYPRSSIILLVPLVPSVRVVEVGAVYFVGMWFALQLSTGGFWADVVGFLAGAGAVVVLRRPERQRVEWWNDVIRRS